MSLNEHTAQNAAIAWLNSLGYNHIPGNALERDLKKVVLENELKNFLKTTYPNVPETARNEAFAQFTQHEGMEVAYRNQDFHRKLTQGIDIAWKDADGNEKAKHLYPIDYTHPENNSFIVSDEVSIVGKNSRRTDLIIFINGLPLIVFEFKNPFDSTVGVENAHRQLHNYLSV